MWMELLKIFREGDTLKSLTDDFLRMLDLVQEMAAAVRPHLFDQTLSMEEKARIRKTDVKVNKLERAIRKQVIAHVTLSRAEVPYCLLLMSLVKDVERMGDYIKNISEVGELGGGAIPEGALRTELAEIVEIAMVMMADVPAIIGSQDRERAHELLQEGKDAGRRCDRLLIELAKSDFDAAQTTSMVLLTRFYKRMGGHLLNILTSVVMPLHKVDFYDERAAALSDEPV
jgi:phosphate transport system protein